MKRFVKALKLYCKATFNPIIAAVGIFIMGGILIAAAVSPRTPDTDEYMHMMGSVGFGQFGIFILLGGVNSYTRNKYFAALPFAKTLFTVAPTVLAAVTALVFDNIAITIAAFRWCEQGLSDLLIIAPINSFMICLAVACIGKPKLELLSIIPIFIISTESMVLPNISLFKHGFGLPVTVSSVIGLLIFISGVALTLMIMNIWWKKCDHINQRYYTIRIQQN